MALRDGLNVPKAKNEADAISDHVCLVFGAYGPGRLLMGGRGPHSGGVPNRDPAVLGCRK